MRGRAEVACQAHNLEVGGSIPSPATLRRMKVLLFLLCFFENPDGTYTLIDYKTDHVLNGHENDLKEKNSNQLKLYKIACGKNLLLKKAQIKKMSGDLSFEKKIVCMFDDITHMNSALYALNLDTHYGVTLVKYHEVFDFKKWWNGGK